MAQANRDPQLHHASARPGMGWQYVLMVIRHYTRPSLRLRCDLCRLRRLGISPRGGCDDSPVFDTEASCLQQLDRLSVYSRRSPSLRVLPAIVVSGYQRRESDEKRRLHFAAIWVTDLRRNQHWGNHFDRWLFDALLLGWKCPYHAFCWTRKHLQSAYWRWQMDRISDPERCWTRYGAGEYFTVESRIAEADGCSKQQAIQAVQAVVSPSMIPTATATVAFAQTFGAALFTSLGQTTFLNLLGPALHQYAPNVDAQAVINTGATNYLASLPHDSVTRKGVLLAYNQAITRTFYLAVGCGVAAFVASLGIGRTKVQTKKEKKAKAKKADEEKARNSDVQPETFAESTRQTSGQASIREA